MEGIKKKFPGFPAAFPAAERNPLVLGGIRRI